MMRSVLQCACPPALTVSQKSCRESKAADVVSSLIWSLCWHLHKSIGHGESNLAQADKLLTPTEATVREKYWTAKYLWAGGYYGICDVGFHSGVLLFRNIFVRSMEKETDPFYLLKRRCTKDLVILVGLELKRQVESEEVNYWWSVSVHASAMNQFRQFCNKMRRNSNSDPTDQYKNKFFVRNT